LFFPFARVRLSTEEELTFIGGLAKSVASEWESFRKSVANWQ